MSDLQGQFGSIDIYLFDQLLRGRILPGSRIVDVGCGQGRNLVYLLQSGFEVFGVDPEPDNIRAVQRLAATLAPALPAANFRIERAEDMSLPDGFAQVVIASAVLHFARDAEQFRAMVDSMWRVLAPAGVLFARLASTIGIELEVQPLGGGRYLLPDGSERYLVDAETLLAEAERLGGTLLDPIKTTVVHGQRAMTTWVLAKDPTRT